MRYPMNPAFSSKYMMYVMFGALGSLDHGFCGESDMARTCTRRAVSCLGGGSGMKKGH